MRNWCENINLKNYKSLSIIIAWGIWIARNTNLFDDKLILTIQFASHGINIPSGFKQAKNEKPPRQIVVERVDRSKAWA
jgi:hypothetical protein